MKENLTGFRSYFVVTSIIFLQLMQRKNLKSDRKIQKMRIIEHTKDILILYNSARDFWFGNIFILFFCPPCFVLLLVVIGNIWWKFLWLFIIATTFFIVLKQIWASDVVKFCSFNKSCRKITIEYHGFQAKTKDFPLQDARVKVRHNIGFAYGATVKNFELLLVDPNNFAGGIVLAEPYNQASKAEIMLDRVQEFLMSSDRLT
jgi:hypothetical protein